MLFNIERAIAVYFPLTKVNICSIGKRNASIFLITSFGSLFYSVNLWTTEIKTIRKKCLPIESWMFMVRYLSVLDVIFTMIVPFFLITVLNFFIWLKMNCPFLNRNGIKTNLDRKITKKQIDTSKLQQNSFSINDSIYTKTIPNKSLQVPNKKEVAYNSSICREVSSKINSCSLTDLNKNKILNQKSCRDSCTLVYTDRKSIAGISNIQERKRVYSRTTKILFAMSTAFLILNGPIALCKIIGFVYLKIETDPDKNSTTIEVTPNEYFFSTKNFLQR